MPNFDENRFTKIENFENSGFTLVIENESKVKLIKGDFSIELGKNELKHEMEIKFLYEKETAISLSEYKNLDKLVKKLVKYRENGNNFEDLVKKNKDYIVGGIYEDEAGVQWLYLGKSEVTREIWPTNRQGQKYIYYKANGVNFKYDKYKNLITCKNAKAMEFFTSDTQKKFVKRVGMLDLDNKNEVTLDVFFGKLKVAFGQNCLFKGDDKSLEENAEILDENE